MTAQGKIKLRAWLDVAVIAFGLVGPFIAGGTAYVVTQAVHGQRIDTIEKKQDSADTREQRIEAKLNRIAEDVSEIRGKLAR